MTVLLFCHDDIASSTYHDQIVMFCNAKVIRCHYGGMVAWHDNIMIKDGFIMMP
jgi:hypothetical protein